MKKCTKNPGQGRRYPSICGAMRLVESLSLVNNRSAPSFTELPTIKSQCMKLHRTPYNSNHNAPSFTELPTIQITMHQASLNSLQFKSQCTKLHRTPYSSNHSAPSFTELPTVQITVHQASLNSLQFKSQCTKLHRTPISSVKLGVLWFELCRSWFW
jgi:hypothetical protein